MSQSEAITVEDENLQAPNSTLAEHVEIMHDDFEEEDKDASPTDPELNSKHAQQIVAFLNRITELEARMKADDARRETEVESIRIATQARLLALENKVAEIQSRVQLLQASLVSSGVTITQRRQKA